MGQDIWIPDEDAGQPRLRVRVHYNHSDIQKYNSMVEDCNEKLEQDVNEVTWIKKYLADLTETVDIFNKIIVPLSNKQLSTADIEDLEIEKQRTNTKLGSIEAKVS